MMVSALKRCLCIVLGLFLITSSMSPTLAAPLDLDLAAAPDIYSSFIDVTYDATTDKLTANGFALNMDLDGMSVPYLITNGTFMLMATIDVNGVLGLGGTVVIGGTIPALGLNSETLIAGNLTHFGFQPGGGDPLEFRFIVTGGDIATNYGAATGGIILSESGFPGSFAANFNNLMDNVPGTGNGAADTAPARNLCRMDISDKGSLLLFSKIEIKWSGDGRELLQDTFLSLTNDNPNGVDVQAYFINGDRALERRCSDDRCQTVIQEFEPGWNTADCRFHLTGGQPHSWSAARGSNKCQPFAVLDENGPGRPDPETLGTTRVLRGFLVLWAVKFNADAPDTNDRGLYEQIRWNHLEGSAVLVNYQLGWAWEYNAWAFQVCNPVVANGQTIGEPGRILLNGLEYNLVYSDLLLDFYASSSQVFSTPNVPVSVQTDLTVHAVDLDLRQDGCGPVLTKVEADIWNEFEAKFSGTRRCVCCWDQTMLASWSRNASIPNHFVRSALRTDKGKAKLNGVESNECDYETLCGRAPGNCGPTAGAQNGFSQATPLLGLATKFLSFSIGTTPNQEAAGMNLVGMGEEAAVILYDPVEGPSELTGERVLERLDGEGPGSELKEGDPQPFDAATRRSGDPDRGN